MGAAAAGRGVTNDPSPKARIAALGSGRYENLNVCIWFFRPGRVPLASCFMSDAAAPSADSLEVIRQSSRRTYAQRTGTYFCSDPGVTAVVLEGSGPPKGRAWWRPLSLRHYEDKQADGVPGVLVLPLRAHAGAQGMPLHALPHGKTTPSAARTRPSASRKSVATPPAELPSACCAFVSPRPYPAMCSTATVGDLVSQPYKYGFVTDIETEKIHKG